MKIDDRSNLGGVGSPAAKGTGAVEGGGRQESGRAVERSGADRAELSGLAGKIAGATSVDAQQRAEKVQRLKVEVAAGRYVPQAAETSRGIVDDALTSSATAGGSQEK